MFDPRIERMADVLINYSLDIQPDELLVVQGSSLAEPLINIVFRKAIEAGAHPTVLVSLPGLDEWFLRHASDTQLSHLSPFDEYLINTTNARLSINAEVNTRGLSTVDPTRSARVQRAREPILHRFLERSANGELKWCGTLFPMPAYAQDAEMSLEEYESFVFEACHVTQSNPVAIWRGFSQRQAQLIDWLKDRHEIRLLGPDTDLTVRVDGRTWINAAGKHNFPDGEVYTGPIEPATQGYIRYSYPAVLAGREVDDVRLWFQDGRVVKATAAKNAEFLQTALNIDLGACYLGEFAIGTNWGVTRFTKNILFDEKIGGTVHLALGAAYPDTGGRNRSALHWDMVCDLRQGGEIWVDGELLMKDGRFVLAGLDQGWE
jgi:aminopeptidase